MLILPKKFSPSETIHIQVKKDRNEQNNTSWNLLSVLETRPEWSLNLIPFALFESIECVHIRSRFQTDDGWLTRANRRWHIDRTTWRESAVHQTTHHNGTTIEGDSLCTNLCYECGNHMYGCSCNMNERMQVSNGFTWE